MFNYEEFKFEIVKGLKEFYHNMGQEIEVTIQKKQKINSTKVEGINIIKKNSNTNMLPCIWLEELFDDYHHGVPVETIVCSIIQLLEKSSIKRFDVEWFRDWEKVKDHIQCRILNTTWNPELLKSVPHIQFWDLSVVFTAETVYPQDGYITIKNEHLELWKITKEELVNTAMENSRKAGYIVMNMLDVMAEMMRKEEQGVFRSAVEEELPKDGPVMYVMTNPKKHFGAAVILQEKCLENVAEQIGGSYYILPSSIHELIAVGATEIGAKKSGELTQMVREINATVVDESERLSSHVYYYDAVRKAIMLVGNTDYMESA